jgi:Phage integrase, N-terminal SAM-like domain
LLAQVAADAWVDPRRGRITFNEWADRWWQLWSSAPRRSPKGKETTHSHLRRHLRPYFGHRQLRQITPSVVLRWQHDLEGTLGHSGVMACRSILLRIMEAARTERLIASNPVRDVEAPKPRVSPERVFGHERRRTLTPRSSATSLPPAGRSTATISSPRSAPGCAAASCSACAAAACIPSLAASR